MRTSLFMGLCTLASHSSSNVHLFLVSILSISRISWSTFRYVCETLPPLHTCCSFLLYSPPSPLHVCCTSLFSMYHVGFRGRHVFVVGHGVWIFVQVVVVHLRVAGTCSFGTMAGSTHRLTFLGHALAGQAVEVEVRGHVGGCGTSMETTSGRRVLGHALEDGTRKETTTFG